MSVKNTGSFTQFPRSYQIQLSTANTNYTSPTTPGLLWVASPDGTDIWDISVTPTATVTTANQMQFFQSPDGGTTFNLLPFSAVMATYTMAQTTALPVTHIPHPNGVPMGPTNPWELGGVTGLTTLSMAQSALTEQTNLFYGGVTNGSANAQTCPVAINSSLTVIGASPATGSIVDFECGVTNSGAATLKVGAQTGTPAIQRLGTAAALSAGDLTKFFRYRAIWDGTAWNLLMTNRLYCAMGQAQAVVFSAVGADR
jgi:hypothetical protein